MKKLITLIIIILSNYTYSQFKQDESNSINYNVLLQDYIVGKWSHVQSTYPSGNQENYSRTFDLFPDSTWLCSSAYDINPDSVTSLGYWYIRDTTIYLYTLIDTNIILGDVVKIEHVEDTLMFLKRIWGLPEARKTSMYKRIR